MDGYVLSDSGVRVWTAPEAHPLLRHTDTAHPAFREKLAETYSRGKVKGLPRVLSENSEDACTWYYFSPLLHDESGKARVLTNLLTQSFPMTFSLRSSKPHRRPRWSSGQSSCPLRVGHRRKDHLSLT